jgi:6-phosphogluconolactonase
MRRDAATEVEVFPDLQGLALAAARRLVALAAERAEEAGRVSIALSGGRTPLPLYELLAGALRGRVPWDVTELYFGDERCVPPTHPDSNYAAARRALLSRVPAAKVFRIEGERPPEAAARDYDATLHAAFPDPLAPTFDLALLGVGADGHTASLFPGSPALDEGARWAVAVPSPATAEPRVPRVTLTPPVLGRSREAWFLCAGTDKREVVARILAGRAPELPAARVRGTLRTVWLLDRAARGDS